MDKNALEQLKLAPKITTCFVDLDNTLWEGILAEGQKPKLFQRRYDILNDLHTRGIQLYVVSKNDEADVNKAFVDLKIDKRLFIWVIANWDQKFVNIERLIRIGEIRPETAVFIDDNVFELHEVKNKIPALHILEADDMEFILSIPAIINKKPQISSEIEERKNRYRTAIEAEFLKRQFVGDDLKFLRQLKRTIKIGVVPADNLDRATRLLVETHRLNFNPGKFAEYDKALDYIHERFNAGDDIYAVATSEGEHSLGLTGILVVHIDGKAAIITDGSFSCGIIGRDFESKTILFLISKLAKQGIEKLDIVFTLTATNVRMKEIVVGLGFKETIKTMDAEGNLHLEYSLSIKEYRPKENYDWIVISLDAPTFDYVGHPFVIKFFSDYVKPLMTKGARVANIGSARGEVLGLLQTSERKNFYRFIDECEIKYTKVDMAYYPDEDNTVANAENLAAVFEDESQDLVMAVELLEHTQKPWLIINEMSRICKVGGYMFITVPSFGFAKHEYPIDLWRFGPKTIRMFFTHPGYKVVKLEIEGQKDYPRRTMILVKKTDPGQLDIYLPVGSTDIGRGLTIFE